MKWVDLQIEAVQISYILLPKVLLALEKQHLLGSCVNSGLKDMQLLSH